MTPADEATFITLWSQGLTTAVAPNRPPGLSDRRTYHEAIADHV
jgi:hypothetical protein